MSEQSLDAFYIISVIAVAIITMFTPVMIALAPVLPQRYDPWRVAAHSCALGLWSSLMCWSLAGARGTPQHGILLLSAAYVLCWLLTSSQADRRHLSHPVPPPAEPDLPGPTSSREER
ncbi:hypothetical protein [Nesterenkonia rhizosphaerae]|uniref:PQ-loop repeat-containing protein n=1 Tax=Nesterenkonia rhizosphaerae TaxID=1348272 RepID=A0ABP9G0P4_9MICC